VAEFNPDLFIDWKSNDGRSMLGIYISAEGVFLFFKYSLAAP